MKRIVKFLIKLFLILIGFSLLQVIYCGIFPVRITPLMIIRKIEAFNQNKPTKIYHYWVSGEELPSSLQLAVMASEDNNFMTHRGFEWEQIKIAREEAEKGKRLRGASTISQQTAKNVFLWPQRSYVRKVLEAYYTFLIETFWSKERIMTVYLNSIEMGNHIFGAEAVARINFNKSAKSLTTSESALIAATLPDPRRFNSAKPSTYLLKRQKEILNLIPKLPKIKE